MAKGILKSIRISEDVLAIIEAQPGETFTAKLEGMIRTCYQEMDRKQAELASVQKTIDTERTRLRRIREDGNKLVHTMSELKWSLDSITRQTKQATANLAKLIGEE